jgi:diguanylate cyclase (GGDEF)-like protein
MTATESGTGIGKRIGQLVSRAVFAAVVTSALILTVFKANQDIEAARDSLTNTGYVLASSAAEAVSVKDQSRAQAALTSVSRLPNIEVVSLLDGQGTSIASIGQATFLTDTLASDDTNNAMLLLYGKMPVAVDIIRGGTNVGRLAMLADISHVRTDFVLSVLSTIICSLIAAWIGVAFSKPLQRRISEPVTEMTRQIMNIRRSKDYVALSESNQTIGEVRLLVDSFNALMGDVRQRDLALKKLAFQDQLTGLPNREAMLAQLEQLEGAMTGALAMIDLRRFRSLNEAFGQSVGDGILLSVAEKLRLAVGKNLLARAAGHTFAVYMPEAVTREQADSIIRDLRAQFATPIAIGNSGIRVDVDAGIFMFAESVLPQINPDMALQSVGLALNQARLRNMPGSTYFTEDMRERARNESETGQELRIALAEGGLEVHYQSVMDLTSGAITGFEALCRWCHPKKGYISPALFIPVAEANGLIAELGRWVLNESCRQASQWQRQTGKRRVVSVNVSAAQFLEAGFTEEVEACLKRHGLPAELLCLELTESVFIGASAAAIRESLYVLSGLGVKLALDDFGTGYSSLGYLARLPFSTIKVDRAFVANAESTPRRKALLKSIIDMSHSVGMDVVAEGAETRAELQMLQELGAEKVQGFVVARPLPAAEAYVAAQATENAVYISAPVDRVA